MKLREYRNQYRRHIKQVNNVVNNQVFLVQDFLTFFFSLSLGRIDNLEVR